MAEIPVYVSPTLDQHEAEVRHQHSMSLLASAVQHIAFECFPAEAHSIHEALHVESMKFADGLKLLVHRWLVLFAATLPPASPPPEPEKDPTMPTREERDEAMRKALQKMNGVAAAFSSAPMPESEDVHHRALDLAASTMMFHSRIAPNSDLTEQMAQLIIRYIAGPFAIEPWQVGLAVQFELAPFWLRGPKKFTSRKIAMDICRRVAALPGAPTKFKRVSATQLSSLETVVAVHLHPNGKEFRLPSGKHAGGRGPGRTNSSWQMAMEFAEALDLRIQPLHEARRPSRAGKVKRRRRARK